MKIRKEIEQVVERASLQENEARKSILNSLRTRDNIDELVLRHAVSQRAAAKTAGVPLTVFRQKAQDAIDKGMVAEPMFEKNRYQYSLQQMHQLLDYMKIPSWKDEYETKFVSAISNLKGGTGKSTTTISLAMGLALNIRLRPRVLVVDLDPQGSLLNMVAPHEEQGNDFISAVDIMLGELEPEGVYQRYRKNGLSHEDIVKGACHPTHIPNLDILPSFTDDERYNFEVARAGNESRTADHVTWLRKKVIDILLPEYDAIFIDTGPNRSPLLWTALDACNGLIVPITPHALDYMSTISFLEGLDLILDMTERRGEQIKWWQAVAVNYDQEHKRDDQVLGSLKDGFGRHMGNSVIKRSSAFESASRNYRTIFDILKTDGECPPRQLDRAQDSVKDVVRELIMKMKDVDSQEREHHG